METTFEKLSDKICVCISNLHRFGTDAFLLANFSAPLKKDTVCDLGTGCGIIPLILERDFSPKKIVGVEIQQEAFNLFELGIKKSGLTDKITPSHSDLKAVNTLFPHGDFDVVTCNPPYKAKNAGIKSSDNASKIARHEILCDINDVCNSASHLLRFGGKLCLCQRPERLGDVIVAMKNAKIEPKRLRFVSKNSTSAPWLFLIEGKKGSKPFMRIEPPLFIRSQSGISDELLSIYGDGKESIL